MLEETVACAIEVIASHGSKGRECVALRAQCVDLERRSVEHLHVERRRSGFVGHVNEDHAFDGNGLGHNGDGFLNAVAENAVP